MKAREAAAKAHHESRRDWGGEPWESLPEEWRARSVRALDTAIDAYLAALFSVPDEQLGKIEFRVTNRNQFEEGSKLRAMADADSADDVPTLLAEVRRLRTESTALGAELAGRDLACWCPLDQPCHADVLLELANPAGEERQ